MAIRCINFVRNIKPNTCYVRLIRHNSMSLSKQIKKSCATKEFTTENQITYLDDPNTFGTLSERCLKQNMDNLIDEGDIKEASFQTYRPLPTQKLTIKQYADLIKQYLKYKRLKEAIDILEIRMLKDDKVQPDNYIYNILIGACAEVGYTKKAFKLYNDMKKRALKPTGDTYTCLFQSCMNSPWKENGLKNATHLRNLMIEKGIEPNITIYNVMIKTFGRCGDLQTAFKLVDEMISKKIKIRVHTFNHLLHACISDKESGLRHGLVVWRKMLNAREKPNLYSFNLMLKCVKDCKLGTNEDIHELIRVIKDISVLKNCKSNILQIGIKNVVNSDQGSVTSLITDCNDIALCKETDSKSKVDLEKEICMNDCNPIVVNAENTNIIVRNHDNLINIDQIKRKYMQPVINKRTVPNLLSKTLQMDHVYGLQEVDTIQDRFAIVGGQDDFLKEMEPYLVKPDIKTFTQMVMLIDDSTEAENKLLETMKSLKICRDISFYNMLMKKRCLRLDYNNAFAVKDLIEKDIKQHSKHPWNKKHKIKVNLITYGILAMACPKKEHGEKLINEMKEQKLKVNIEILGTLLKHGTTRLQFDYILYIMRVVKEEKVNVNDIFLKHLEEFSDKCMKIIGDKNQSVLSQAYNVFNKNYKNWLDEIKIEEALKTEHPWQQFQERHPEPVQKENIEIKEPKWQYKRNRKYIRYAPRV